MTMGTPKRLVLFVEGEGDAEAAVVLLRRLLTEQEGWDALFLDENPFPVGNVQSLLRKGAAEWIRYLKAAARTRRNLGAVLVLLDGDTERIEGKPFCVAEVARTLSAQAVPAGGGDLFSVANVFALQEYESWLIAGVESLAGKLLPDSGRPGVRAGTVPPAGDLERSPRDAKKWLSHHMHSGYKPTKDQTELIRLVDFRPIRDRGMSSFARLERAVGEIIEALRSGQHVLSPAPPEP